MGTPIRSPTRLRSLSMSTPRVRANGEGSLFAYRNGYAAYVWVTTPVGTRERKWIYGQERDELHGRWIDLQKQAKSGPVARSEERRVGKECRSRWSPYH